MATLQLSVAVAVVSLHFGGVSEHGNEILENIYLFSPSASADFPFTELLLTLNT